MVIKIFLILMIIFSILAVQTPKLRRAVIYLGIFSLISSFMYLLYQAPDVAIAEAIIGSTLATILFLVALQKYRVFTIYYTNENFSEVNDEYINTGRTQILNLVEKFCISQELEPQVIYTTDKVDNIKTNESYDLVIRQKEETFFIYGNQNNYQLDSLIQYVSQKQLENIKFIMNRDEEEL